MGRKPRSLECPQCGERIAIVGTYCCHTCGYVLDMARISYEGALRHDRYEVWRRRMELVHALAWALVSVGVLYLVAFAPGPIIFTTGIVGAIVQLCWGKVILCRLRKR